MGKKTYTGVLEFSAEEGLVYLPIWVIIKILAKCNFDVDDEPIVFGRRK